MNCLQMEWNLARFAHHTHDGYGPPPDAATLWGLTGCENRDATYYARTEKERDALAEVLDAADSVVDHL